MEHCTFQEDVIGGTKGDRAPVWGKGVFLYTAKRSGRKGRLSARAGIAQSVERPTEKPGAVLTRVRVPGNFLPKSTFSADSLTVSVHPRCAIACINICAHVKNPKRWQHTLIEIGSAALAAAVHTQVSRSEISRKGQRSTTTTKKRKKKRKENKTTKRCNYSALGELHRASYTLHKTASVIQWFSVRYKTREKEAWDSVYTLQKNNMNHSTVEKSSSPSDTFLVIRRSGSRLTASAIKCSEMRLLHQLSH